MYREVTHIADDFGVMRQIVSPSTLKKILDRDGDDYDRPKDFEPDDEWKVETEGTK